MHSRFLLLFASLFLSVLSYSQTPAHWYSRGVGGGGALFSPSINPANDNEYYIGCDMSELFHSTDYGVNTSVVPFTQTEGGHNSKVQFTNNPNILYSISYAADAPFPVKTTNGGASWAALASDPDPGYEYYSINVDYNNPNKLAVSTENAVYFSSNGGASFTSIQTDGTGNGMVVGGAFFDGNNIYIGTNNGLLVSTNGGTSFTNSGTTGITSGQVIFSFTGAKSGGTTRLLCLTASSADVTKYTVGSDYYNFVKGVYTLDVGGNWVSKMTGINTSVDYMMFVGMAQNDINTMYLAGSKNSEPAVMKSTNAGGQWGHVMITSGNGNVTTGWQGANGDRGWSYGECAFGFTVAPNNANKVLITDFGFVHKTSNGGTSWDQAYVKVSDQHPAGANTPKGTDYHSSGLENTTCWQVVWGDANTMMAGFSDIKGVRSTDAGNTFNFNYSGHAANSMYRIAQHTNGTWYAGTSDIHDMYQSTRLADNPLDNADANGKIIMSTNKGSSWTLVHQFGHPVFWVAIDPNVPDRMYASVINSATTGTAGGIYVTNNLSAGASSTWTKLTDPPRTEGHPASIVVLNDGKVVVTYSGHRDPGFTASSGCFIYNPTTSSWTDVSDPGMQYWTKDVVIDPADPTQNTWYVCVFSGWGGAPNGLGGLYRTTNRGANWLKIADGAPLFDRVTSITFNPDNFNQAYLTTEQAGLLVSNDMNATTPSWNLVSEYPFRQPERVFFNPYNHKEIWVTSFGNGLKMGNTSTDTIFAMAMDAYGAINGIPAGNDTVVVNYGDSAQINYFATSGAHIDSVLVDGVKVDTTAHSYTFYDITVNHTLKLYCSPNAVPQFTITSSSGPNGTIAPLGAVMVNVGDSSVFTFTPNSGYQVDSVIVDGVMLGAPTSYTFYNVTTNHTIRVVFAINLLTQYTITATSGPDGTIAPIGAVMVNSGDSSLFTFTPNSGFHVDSVFVDGVMIGNPASYTFTSVSADHTIHVVFAQDTGTGAATYQIFASTDGNGGISPMGSVTVNANDSAVFTYTPNPGYHLDSVIVDGIYVGTPASYTFYNIVADHTIRIVFAQNPAGQYSITATSGSNGSVSPSGISFYNPGDNATYSFIPAPGFTVDSIYIDGTYIGPDTAYTFFLVFSDHTLHVTFRPDTFQIVSSTDALGTITPLGTTNVVGVGTQSYTMVANPGFHLDSVIVDDVYVGNNPFYSFTSVVADHTIRAVYAINGVPVYYLHTFAQPGGSISPGGNVPVAQGDNAHLYFIPAQYHDVDSVWIDSVLIPNTYEYTFVNVNSDHYIEVSFSSSVGIAANKKPLNAALWPVPTNNSATLTFELTQAAEVSIQVRNLTGQLVQTILNKDLQNGPHSVAISKSELNLSAGLYFVQLSDGKQNINLPLVIE